MCGRCACTLDPEILPYACNLKDSLDKPCKTTWAKSELKYIPSPNLGPKDYLPCLIAGSHLKCEEDIVLCPMMWSMIPPWHKGDYKKSTLSTHNGRIEKLSESSLYSTPLRNGCRCVILCEGFYEWKAGQTKKDSKQPYFIYASQENNAKINENTKWDLNNWSDHSGWDGLKLLKLAGIFNTFWTEDGKMIHSCTVITRESNSVMSWLHHRVPLFLNTEDEIRDWLKSNLTLDKAIEKLKKLELKEGVISWHPVSTLVNNVMHKSIDCKKEFTLTMKEKKEKSAGFMASWLQKGNSKSTKRKNDDDSYGNDKKK